MSQFVWGTLAGFIVGLIAFNAVSTIRSQADRPAVVGAAVPAPAANARARAEAAVRTALPFSYAEIVSFDGPGGLIGIEARSGGAGATDVYWATGDGSHLILGPVVDQNGINPTVGVASARGIDVLGIATAVNNASGTVVVLDDDAKALEDLVSIDSGEGPVTLYVFVDPACPHCRNVYRAAQQDAVQANLRIRWILVEALGGAQTRTRIDQYRTGKISFEHAMMAPWSSDAFSGEVSAETDQYLVRSVQMLERTARRPAVPAVIFHENGRWVSQTGLDLSRHVPETARQAVFAAQMGSR